MSAIVETSQYQMPSILLPCTAWLRPACVMCYARKQTLKGELRILTFFTVKILREPFFCLLKDAAFKMENKLKCQL